MWAMPRAKPPPSASPSVGRRDRPDTRLQFSRKCAYRANDPTKATHNLPPCGTQPSPGRTAEMLRLGRMLPQFCIYGKCPSQHTLRFSSPCKPFHDRGHFRLIIPPMASSPNQRQTRFFASIASRFTSTIRTAACVSISTSSASEWSPTRSSSPASAGWRCLRPTARPFSRSSLPLLTRSSTN